MLIVRILQVFFAVKKYCASVGFYDNAENIGRSITGKHHATRGV